MGAQRGPTAAEEKYNHALHQLLDIGKILWHMTSEHSLVDPKGTKVWAKAVIEEEVGNIKSHLDQMLEKLNE